MDLVGTGLSALETEGAGAATETGAERVAARAAAASRAGVRRIMYLSSVVRM